MIGSVGFRLFGVMLAAGLSGCIPPIYFDREDYPSDWPPQERVSEGCPQLSGDYRNAGEGRFAVPLARHVLHETADPLKQVEQLRFDGPRVGQVRVELLDGHGKVLLERHWREGPDYSCDEGWLVRRQTYFWATPVLSGTDSQRFARSQAGDLLVQTRTEAGGVFLVLPVYRGERFWFRYQAADRTAPPSHQIDTEAP